MAKENDFFLNTVENPTFNPIDFASVGLNAGNTSIEPKDTYENIDAIKLMDQFQTNGAYDPHKFDAFYNLAAYGFNRLADLDTAELIANEPTFYKYDITVPLSERKLTPDFVVKKVANPLRQRVGFQDFNLKEAPEYTVDEIAQTNKVYDVETGKWIDSPNDTWLENFLPGNAKVLATYDEDTVDTDPITGELVQHKKGDLKLNDSGEPYYETLGKRSIYDKKVLSGFDTLTVDGSTWNKFDFMDSDSKDKSIGGTLVKNAIKIVPAFVSGVSPIYIGARIALNAADLFAKAGKMLTGSDNSFLTGVEAFNKLWTTGASEYSQGDQYFGTLTAHAWSMENLLNVGADVFTQLAEQRFLFHQVPALMKGTGKLGYDLATRKKFVDTEADKFMDEHIHNVLTLAKNSKNVGKDLEAAKQFAYKAAESKLTAIDESLSKIGENISKAYMTGITVADSYGEAKNSGASDLEAALFTLGYATGEWKLLNTGIGEHILPELRANKIKLRLSLKKYLYGTAKEIKPSGAASAAEKATWARRWMQKGLNFFKSLKDFDVDDSVLASVSKMTAAHSLGEGLEEVSEEALLDMSKALFDGIAWLRGDDTRLGPFDNYNLSSVINRYGLSLVGGAMGGALSNFLPGMSTFQDIKSPASMEEAHRILVEAVASGKKNDLLKIINDTTWGPRSLSATLTLTKDGITTYAAGTELDNWDANIKRVLTQSINNIENILSANGINMSKDLQAFLTERTIPEFRKLALGASVSKYYANLYYNDLTALTELQSKIDSINKGTTAEGASSSTDSSAKAAAKTTEVDGATSGTLPQLKSRLAKVKERLTKYNDGTMRSSYTRDILYQLSPAFTSSYWVDPEIGGNLPSDFLTYINYKYGISPDALPEYIKNEEQDFWKNAKYLDEPERIHLSRLMFDKFNEHVSKTLGQHAEEYYHQATKLNFFDSIQLEFYNPSSKNKLLEGEQIDPLTGEARTEGTEAKLTKLGESGSDNFIPSSEGYLDVRGIQPDIAIGKELGISNSRKWRTLSEMNKFLKDSSEVSDEAKKLLKNLDYLPKVSGYAQVLQALKANSEKVFNDLKDLKISKSGITIQEDFWNYVTNTLNRKLKANEAPAEDIKSFNTEEGRVAEEPLTVELAQEFVQWYNKKNNSDLLQTLNLYLGYFSSSPNRFKILVPAIEDEDFATLILATSMTEELIKYEFEGEDKLYEAIKILLANPTILNTIISTSADATLGRLLTDTTVQNEFLNQLKSQNYLTPALKNYLTSLFKEYGVENQALIDEINDKAESDILKLLDTFKISAQGGRKASEIIKLAEDALSGAVKSGDLERLQLSDLDAELTNILTLIHRLGDHVGAARTDNGNLDNLYGYNHTVNYLEGLDEEHKLITLTTNVANSMLYDLARLYDHVKYLKGLYDFNSNKKLSEHSKLKTQLTVLKYLKLKTIVIALPEKDFPDKSKILSVLEECTLHNELSGKPILPILDLEKENELLAERIKIENAVNEYFSDMDLKKLELFAENTMNFLGIDRTTGLTSAVGYNLEYDLNSESISDRQFWWWLTSCAALRGDMFIRDYNDALAAVDAKIIPIPGLEELIRQAYSKTVNQRIFDKFTQVFNNTCVEEIRNLSDDIKDKAIRSLEDVGFAVDSLNLSDSSFTIFYPNTYLFEGSAGSGKTTGTVTTLINILRLKLQDIILKRKPIFVGLTIKAAEKLASDNGFTPGKDCRCFTHLEYMEFITKGETYPKDGYKDFITGEVTISNDDLINNETTGYHTKYKNVELNDLLPKEEYPGLIVVDEVTKLSQQDLFVSDDFAKYCGATVICTGDYKQQSVWGETEETDNMKALVLQTFGTNFISGIKLSQSMRSNNTYKDSNITRLRLRWEKLKTGILEGIAPADALELDYFEETNPESPNYGFYGDKAVTIGASEKEDLELKLSIQLMLNTLAEGETINVIIPDEDSELYKLLERINRGDAVEGIEGTYKDKFTFIRGQAVQGTEGQYYIVDYRTYLSRYLLNPELPLKELNTYISRAKLGTLLVYLNQEIANANSIYIQNKLLKSLYKTALSEQAKLDYKERLMLAIKQYLDSVESIPKTPEVKKSGSTGTKSEGSEGSEGSEEPDTESGTKSGKEVNTDEDPEEVQNLETLVEAGHREVLLDQSSTPGEFNSILWSLGCNKLGCTIKYDGKPIKTESDWEKLGDGRRTIAAMDKKVTLEAPEDFEGRIDNLNGLLKLTSKSYDNLNLEDEDGKLTLRETYLAALNRLREAARSMSMENFLDTLTSILEDLGIDLTDVLFSWVVVKKLEASTDILTKAHPKEFLESSLTNDSLKARLGIVDRTVDLVIYRKNAEGKMSPILDLELYGFTNPITMLYTEAYSTNPENEYADKFIEKLNKKLFVRKGRPCYNLLQVFEGILNLDTSGDSEDKKKNSALAILRDLVLETLLDEVGGITLFENPKGFKKAVSKNPVLNKYYELYCFILMYHNVREKTVAVPLVDGDLKNEGKSFADIYCKQISSEPISIHNAITGEVRGEGKTEGLEMDQTWISLPKSVLTHAKRNYSRVITLTDQNLATHINMKAGVPFILYTDRLEYADLSTERLFAEFIKQELSKESTKAISFAYITTPGISVSEYVREILLRKLAYNKRKNAKKEDVQDSIGVEEDEKQLTDIEYDHYNGGNTTTNFRLLQLLVNSEDFEAILKERAKEIATTMLVKRGKELLEPAEIAKALLGRYKMLQKVIAKIDDVIKEDTNPGSYGHKLHLLLKEKVNTVLGNEIKFNAVWELKDQSGFFFNNPTAGIPAADKLSLATFIASELEALLLKPNPASSGKPKAEWNGSTKSFEFAGDDGAASFIQRKFECLEELVTKEWPNNGGKVLTRLELVTRNKSKQLDYMKGHDTFEVSQIVGKNIYGFNVAYNVTGDPNLKNGDLYRTLLGEDLLVNAKLDTYHAVANISGIVTAYNMNWGKGGSTLGERPVPNPKPKSAPTLVRTDVKTEEAYTQIYRPASVIMENLKVRKYGKFVKKAIEEILNARPDAFENPVNLQEALNLINKSGITLDSKENVRILAIRDSEKVPQYTLIPIKLGIDLYTWPVINVGNESFPIKQNGEPKLVSKRDDELVILNSPIEKWHESLSIPSNGYEFLYGVKPEQLESLDMERYLNTGEKVIKFLNPKSLEGSSEGSSESSMKDPEKVDKEKYKKWFITGSAEGESKKPGIESRNMRIWKEILDKVKDGSDAREAFLNIFKNPNITNIETLLRVIYFLDPDSTAEFKGLERKIGAVLLMVDRAEGNLKTQLLSEKNSSEQQQAILSDIITNLYGRYEDPSCK